MPLEKLTRAQIQGYHGAAANPEYVNFVRGLKPGEGGRATVDGEGVSRQTIKNRIKSAASELGVKVKFHRSEPNEVRFEVIG
jgi:hypothetical protein